MDSQTPLVSVIIPNYNGKDLLRECLESFGERNYHSVELIVVDNGSDDGSVEMINTDFPNVTLVEVPNKHGLGYVYNVGVKEANGEILVVGFNNDEVLVPGWISKIVEVLQTNDGVDIVGGLRLKYDERDTVDSAGGIITLFKQKNFTGKRRDEITEQPLRFVEYVEVPAFHRDLIEEIGYFSEEYEFYAEDLDFGLRANRAGYQVATVMDAVTYHHRGATSSKSVWARYYNERNRLRSLLKNLPLRRLLPILMFWYLIGFPVRVLQVLLGKGVDDTNSTFIESLRFRGAHIRAMLSGIWWNVVSIKQTLRLRESMSSDYNPADTTD
jgi:GT2 family glycosyltransferase